MLVCRGCRGCCGCCGCRQLERGWAGRVAADFGCSGESGSRGCSRWCFAGSRSPRHRRTPNPAWHMPSPGCRHGLWGALCPQDGAALAGSMVWLRGAWAWQAGCWGTWADGCWGRWAGGCRCQGMAQPRGSAHSAGGCVPAAVCQWCQGSVRCSVWCWWQLGVLCSAVCQCLVLVSSCHAGGSSALVAVCRAGGSSAWCWWQCARLVAAACAGQGSAVCQCRAPCKRQQRHGTAAPDGPVECFARG